MYLENLDRLFEALSRGRHISSRDGDLFESLNKAPSEYQSLFGRLGFELVSSARGYFYFNGSNRGLSKGVNRIALFVYIFMEHSADQGEGITDAIGTGSHSIASLPHLTNERYRKYLKQVGVQTPEQLGDILRLMENFGFIRRDDNEYFAFLSPVYRIIDACESVSFSDSATVDEDDATANNDSDEEEDFDHA